MDKASDYESGDSRFESWQGRFLFIHNILLIYYMICDNTFKLKIKMIPPGLEPGTLRVLGARDNHYTTESMAVLPTIVVSCTTGQKG